MNCPKCRSPLKETDHKGVRLHRCTKCEGFWFEGKEFQQAMEQEDRFLRWADLDLWKKDENHQLKNRTETCPDCAQYLFEVKYKGYDIHPWVCVDCRGIWVEKDEFKKLVAYLEKQIDSKTVTDFIKYLNKESIEILDHDSLGEQLKDLGMVLKLIGYRLASKFSLIEKLSKSLPKP